jgi:glutamyl-tRNA synthetase
MSLLTPTSAVRVRIAPSPTGDPHVGTAYIGLFNLAFARRHGGQFVLRIEDTDQKRSTAASEAAIFRSLRWLGLQWDEGPDIGGPCGPYRQSERGAIYRDHADILLANRTAYRCFCTPDRLDQVRAVQRAAKQTARYDGHCRDLDPATGDPRARAGEPHVVRLRMPQDGATEVHDGLRGVVTYDNRQIDDQVLLKADGLPTYHLANVVDDHLMGITHVIRAEEWLNSTPKHLALYAAFGWQAPVFVHMPLLRNADKSKISKRKNPTSLEYYRRAGILPEALTNFLALMGYSMKDQDGKDLEVFEFDDLVRELDLKRISLGGPVFDLAKLAWLNGVRLRRLTAPAFADRAIEWLRDDGRHVEVARLVQERVTHVGKFLHHAEPFYLGDDVAHGLDARHLLVGCANRKAKVRLGREASRAFVDDAIERLETLADWSAAAVDEAVRACVATTGCATGDGLMAVRVAMFGRTTSPPLFESMAVLGRAVCVQRLRKASALLRRPDFLKPEIDAARAELDATQAALHASDSAAQPQAAPAASEA